MKLARDLAAGLSTFVLILLISGRVEATTFYVASDGNDQWTGRTAQASPDRKDGPLASFQGARDAVRRLKAKGPLTEPVHVIFAAGTYRLSAPIMLEPADSGTAQCPVTYEAAPQTRPVISGGRAISGFTKGADGVWTAQVPEVKAGQWMFEQLYVNGRRATRARSPNKLYYTMRGKVDSLPDPATGQPVKVNQRAFIADPKDIAPIGAIPKDQIHDATIVVYHEWAVSIHRVESVDPQTGRVVTTGNAPWPFMRSGNDQRYHIENLRAALDVPGEWFLDRNGTLSYIPLPGEDMTKAEVIAPAVAGMVQFVGRGDPRAVCRACGAQGAGPAA